MLSSILSKTEESKWSEKLNLHCQSLLQAPFLSSGIRKSWIFSRPNLKDTFNRPGFQRARQQYFHCPSSILIPAQQGKLSCLLPTDLRAGAKTRERKQYWDPAAGTTAQGAWPVPSTRHMAQLAGSTRKLRLEET